VLLIAFVLQVQDPRSRHSLSSQALATRLVLTVIPHHNKVMPRPVREVTPDRQIRILDDGQQLSEPCRRQDPMPIQICAGMA
jgi:hypothetical protein